MNSSISAKSTMSSKRLVDLAPRQAEHDPVDDHVLTPGDLRVEAGTQLDEGGDSAVDGQVAASGAGDPGHQLEQRRLSGAVLSDDAEGGSARHLEGDAVEGGEELSWPEVGNEAAGEQRALQGLELAALLEAPVHLEHVLGDDRRRAHTPSAKVSRRRSKTNDPMARATRPATRAPPRPRQWSKWP